MTFRPGLAHNDRLVLHKFDKSIFERNTRKTDTANTKSVCFLDLETTGLNSSTDKIVELAIKLVSVDSGTGELIEVLDSYESFNDPDITMTQKNISIHGITNEMVKGHSIDWKRVEEIFINTDIVAAHNAKFDRSFMDKVFPLSEEKIWACTVNDINWPQLGFNSRGQELLCIWHGFFYESHRAMSDVDALTYLVTHDSYTSEKPIKMLIDTAYKPQYKICAINSSIQYKDILRTNGFSWNASEKYWWKMVDETDLENEKLWLEENVYNGTFLGQVELVTPADRYK